MKNKGQRPLLLDSLIDRLSGGTAAALLAGMAATLAVPAFLFLKDGDGGDDDDDGDEGGSSEGADDGDDDDDDDEGDGTGGSGSDTVSRAEFDKIKKRMQAADRRASEAENKVKEFENKDKTEVERVKGELEEVKSDATELAAENQELKAQVAFLQQDKVKFTNTKAALRLAKDYFADNTDDDGNVDMEAVLASVAEDYPELVSKTKDGKDDDDDDGEGKPPRSGSTQRKKKKGSGPDREALRKKYSALRH